MCLSNRLEVGNAGNIHSSYAGGNINTDDSVVYFWNSGPNLHIFISLRSVGRGETQSAGTQRWYVIGLGLEGYKAGYVYFFAI